MALTFEEVRHIASLARIELTPTELENYRSQLSTILDHFKHLQELDTREVPSGASDPGNLSVLRPDQVEAGLSLKALMENAPHVEDDQFQIPPVFD